MLGQYLTCCSFLLAKTAIVTSPLLRYVEDEYFFFKRKILRPTWATQ